MKARRAARSLLAGVSATIVAGVVIAAGIVSLPASRDRTTGAQGDEPSPAGSSTPAAKLTIVASPLIADAPTAPTATDTTESGGTAARNDTLEATPLPVDPNTTPALALDTALRYAGNTNCLQSDIPFGLEWYEPEDLAQRDGAPGWLRESWGWYGDLDGAVTAFGGTLVGVTGDRAWVLIGQGAQAEGIVLANVDEDDQGAVWARVEIIRPVACDPDEVPESERRPIATPRGVPDPCDIISDSCDPPRQPDPASPGP